MQLKVLTRPIKIFSVEIHWWTLMLFMIAFRLEFLHRLLIAYGITALHECAHILVIRRLGIKIKKIEVLPFGITARLCGEGIKKPVNEIKIALAGPLSNFIIAYMAYGSASGWWRDYIVCTSLAIGFFNLIPALPLDGGRVLKALLVRKFGCIRGHGVAMRVTVFCGVAILFVGVWVIYITGFNFSFLIIGAFLIANITEEIKSSNMIVMKDILYSRRKLEEGKGKGEILVVREDEKASNVVAEISYDRYYLIYIVDSGAMILHTLTETAFVEGLVALGIDARMRNFVGL